MCLEAFDYALRPAKKKAPEVGFSPPSSCRHSHELLPRVARSRRRPSLHARGHLVHLVVAELPVLRQPARLRLVDVPLRRLAIEARPARDLPPALLRLPA